MVYDPQPSISSASVLQVKGMQLEWPQPTWILQDDMINLVGTRFILPSVALL